MESILASFWRFRTPEDPTSIFQFRYVNKRGTSCRAAAPLPRGVAAVRADRRGAVASAHFFPRKSGPASFERGPARSSPARAARAIAASCSSMVSAIAPDSARRSARSQARNSARNLAPLRRRRCAASTRWAMIGRSGQACAPSSGCMGIKLIRARKQLLAVSARRRSCPPGRRDPGDDQTGTDREREQAQLPDDATPSNRRCLRSRYRPGPVALAADPTHIDPNDEGAKHPNHLCVTQLVGQNDDQETQPGTGSNRKPPITRAPSGAVQWIRIGAPFQVPTRRESSSMVKVPRGRSIVIGA